MFIFFTVIHLKVFKWKKKYKKPQKNLFHEQINNKEYANETEEAVSRPTH